MLATADYYGNIIREGSSVAFNFQGELRQGFVRAIKPRTQYGKTNSYNGEPLITIHVAEKNTGRISKVSNRKNVLCLTN